MFIKLTKRLLKQGHILVNCDHIVAIEDNRLNTKVKDFAWTNVWLINGVKLEVTETEEEIVELLKWQFSVESKNKL